MSETHCWHCGNPAEHSLFCHFCNSLQRPTPDYFQFFGLEPGFDIDLADLQERFYSLSRRLHPDLHARASARDRQYSLEATAILNDAYRTLRDPVARAEYLLKEQTAEPGGHKPKDIPPELLEEVFELNEALEELRAGDASARPCLEQAHTRFAALRDGIDAELRQLFRAHGESGKPEALAGIRSALARRRYVDNLIGQLGKQLGGC
jgi:molecular chaperone HscB